MTVTTLRPNRPARYKLGDDGRVVMLEDEEPVAAPAEMSDLAVLKSILADPKAAFKLVSDAEAAVSKIAAAKAEDAKDEANRKAKLADFERVYAAQTKKWADEKLAHEQAMAAREAAVVAKEKDVADLERRATRALDEANKLKSTLKARLNLITQAQAPVE